MDDLIFKDLGLQDYSLMQQAMKQFTKDRRTKTKDEIWFCEHPSVFTYGKFADLSHLLEAKAIPVVATDRGGQITYHGPGQLMIYTLIDLRRRKLSIRSWVHHLEAWMVKILEHYDLVGQRIAGRPGIYLGDQKIASIGLRVTRGCTYHGAALNVDMDLSPFQQINPCGYPNQAMTDLRRALNEKSSKPYSREKVIQVCMDAFNEGLRAEAHL